jgi:hypothetical protein
MSNKSELRRLRPGDLVEVRSPEEILQTLDADGAVDHLPFMPEMIAFCGKKFRVAKRVVKTCFSGSISTMLAFGTDDVVTLDGLRCSGAAHDGCQKACMIFWRESWLRKVDTAAAARRADSESSRRLQARLKTSTGPKTYFCQASELLKAAHPLSRWDRFGKCVSEVRAGNCSAFEMARRVSIWLWWRIRRTFRGEYARGPHTTSTPIESLNLRPGETITVKPLESIVDTLNETARNRGLYFSPDMGLLCDEPHRVKARLDKIIVDGTGEMRRLNNTVSLEGSLCGCAQIAFGGCSRCEFVYWREIWLRRPASS